MNPPGQQNLATSLWPAHTGHAPTPDRLAYGSAHLPSETDFDYLPAAQGGHLKTIHHTVGSATISKFDYTYAPDGKIATWTKEQDGDAKFTEFVHDLAGQLTKATTRETAASQWPPRGSSGERLPLDAAR